MHISISTQHSTITKQKKLLFTNRAAIAQTVNEVTRPETRRFHLQTEILESAVTVVEVSKHFWSTVNKLLVLCYNNELNNAYVLICLIKDHLHVRYRNLKE